MADHLSPIPRRGLSGRGRQRRAIETLYRTHVDWLRRALGYRLGNHGIDVDDIVHDAYIRIARYSDEDSIHHPKALLLRIALNLARDQMRRDSKLPANDLDPFEEIASEGDQEYLLALKGIILSLPPDLRNVFLLSRFTAMTNVQIAEHLGVSVKTVEYRMRKALLHCAERLAQ
ncbi:RNA polymerase sigma factor [Blastomonas sp.]|uniref:RNA polymerase sigma factor n=1 Tax=Blastomonas sp. TaxID=1909299 RepID=UPI00262B0C27|nr:RNA polymerase sigma factor [Blastomonas sp.]MDM7955793.1 RNA polymerase sigma factor [Blastomonas sp.]